VERKLTAQEEIKQLKDQLKQTQKILSDAQMMNGYYQQVIEVAEREFRIEIEKSPIPSNQRNDGALPNHKPVPALSFAWYK
jgi:hypothetical protein